ADYSQIELRIAAKVAEDAEMIQAFREGADLHALTARQLTGRSDVSKAERDVAKIVNFGLIYGLSESGLVGKTRSEYGIEMTLKQARKYRAGFFERWPKIKAWHTRLKITHCRQRSGTAKSRQPETRTLTGRRVLVE